MEGKIVSFPVRRTHRHTLDAIDNLGVVLTLLGQRVRRHRQPLDEAFDYATDAALCLNDEEIAILHNLTLDIARLTGEYKETHLRFRALVKMENDLEAAMIEASRKL